MIGDPLSWLLIEKGWTVVGSDGTTLGRVREVVGDPNIDIFDGIVLRTHPPRYIPADRVEAITTGIVRVRVSETEAEGLDAYREPPGSFRWR